MPRLPLVPAIALGLALACLPLRAQEAKSPESAASDDPDATETAASRVPLEEIRRYVSVFNAVKEGYVDPVDDHALMQSAIRGLLLDLDPHSSYLEKRAARAFDENTEGGYSGIGVEVQQQPDGSILVVAPIEGAPAERAGIRSGDRIVRVDGRLLRPQDQDEPLRGKPGTSVRVTLLRKGAAKPLEFTVVREKVRLASVRGRMLEHGYGYLRISQFQVDTAADFESGLSRLQQEAGGRLRGLLIDLRSNPGGLLTAAIQIADDLLERGTIVSTKGRNSASDGSFKATPGDRLQAAPVVLLVDAGSASASEVLAGALRDNGRARIVGSRTFGKGLVQSLLPLDNGDAIKITTARYYTPSGKSIQGVGIAPDVQLKPVGDAGGAATARDVFSEAALPGHLRGEDEPQAGSQAGDVLEGDTYIAAALAELKKAAGTAAAPPAAAR